MESKDPFSKIEDKNGIIIYNHKPKYTDVLSEETNYVMLKLLQGVVDKGTEKG